MTEVNGGIAATEDAAGVSIPQALIQSVSDRTAPAGHPYKVLIVVDSQVDFVMRYGLLSVDGAESTIVPGIGILTSLDGEEYAAVLFTYDTHVAEEYLGSLENIGKPELGIPGFPLHCEKGTGGWENVFNIRLVPKGIPVFELEKDVFDAWEKPSDETLVYEMFNGARPLHGAGMERDAFFARLKALGVTTATVIGVASDFCVKDQIKGLLARSFKVEVIAAATAGIMRDIAQTVADEFPGQVDII